MYFLQLYQLLWDWRWFWQVEWCLAVYGLRWEVVVRYDILGWQDRMPKALAIWLAMDVWGHVLGNSVTVVLVSSRSLSLQPGVEVYHFCLYTIFVCFVFFFLTCGLWLLYWLSVTCTTMASTSSSVWWTWQISDPEGLFGGATVSQGLFISQCCFHVVRILKVLARATWRSLSSEVPKKVSFIAWSCAYGVVLNWHCAASSSSSRWILWLFSSVAEHVSTWRLPWTGQHGHGIAHVSALCLLQCVRRVTFYGGFGKLVVLFIIP